MILFFIFLIISLSILIFIIYTNKKIVTLKEKLIASNRQVTALKSKLAPINTISVHLTFLPTSAKGGIIKENSHLRLAPYRDSHLLHKNKIKMEVYIIDEVKNNQTYWYYVSLPLDSNVNSHGWICGEEFLSLYDNTKLSY